MCVSLPLCVWVCGWTLLCLLPLLVLVPGVLSQTERETMVVSERGRATSESEGKGERGRELAEGSE